MEEKAVIVSGVATLTVFLDQFTKIWASKITETISLIPGFLNIKIFHNSGSIFGILHNQYALLIWFSILVLGVLLYYYEDIPRQKLPQILIGLIAGGTLGNLIDRIRLGAVIDFINVPFFSTFNIADSALTVGIIGLIGYLYWADTK